MNKKTGYFFIVTAALVLLTFLSFLPTLLSTPTGTRWALSFFAPPHLSQLHIENLSLSWFGPQKVAKVTLHDEQGNLILNVDSFESKTPLLTLLLKGPQLQSSSVEKFYAKTDKRHAPFSDLEWFFTLCGGPVEVHIDREQSSESSSWNLKVLAENLKILASAVLDKTSLKLTSPAQIEAHLSTNTYQEIVIKFPWLKVKEGLDAVLLKSEISLLELPLEIFSGEISRTQRKEISLEAHTDLSLAIHSQKPIHIMELAIHSAKGEGDFRIHSKTTNIHENQKHHYDLTASFKKPRKLSELKQVLLRPKIAKLSSEGIPTELLDFLCGSGSLMKQTLGKEVSIAIHSDRKDLQSLAFTIKGEWLDVPQGILHFNEDLTDLDELTQTPLSGNLSLKKISIQKNSFRPSSMENLSFLWNLDPKAQKLSIHFEGQNLPDTPSAPSLSGDIEIDMRPAAPARLLSLQMKATDIASPLLDSLLPHPVHEALFGDEIDMDLLFDQRRPKGVARLNLRGERGSITVDGHVANNSFVLDTPLLLVTQASETLGKQLLTSIAPIFDQLVGTNHPIRLTISPEEFFLPLNLDLQKIQIGKAVLDAGQLVFRNEGDIKNLIAVLKPRKADLVHVWTTPLYLSLKRGTLKVERMDLLMMHRYPIANWGKIDLVKDKVRMFIGLTGTAIGEAFNVEGLDEKTIVQIPIKGSIKNAKIDASKASRKIGALIAQKSKSPEGLLVGAVLGLVNGKEDPAPAPTTSPLPWETKTRKSPQSH